jgi:hypothetical protein
LRQLVIGNIERGIMPIIDMTGLDTQLAPMKAIHEVLSDYYNGFINSKEALSIVNAIACEWRQ